MKKGMTFISEIENKIRMECVIFILYIVLTGDMGNFIRHRSFYTGFLPIKWKKKIRTLPYPYTIYMLCIVILTYST